MVEEFLSNFPGHQILISMPEYNSAPIHFHNGYDKCKDKLKTNNSDKNHGIFFTINELDEQLDPGRHRTKKMVKRCRAVFMDDDVIHDKPRTDFPLVPSIIVNSSPGKYHYYWLTDTTDFSMWDSVQGGIIQIYQGDKQAKDITRYLRLPGYYHMKDKDNPHLVSYEGGFERYPWDTIVDKMPHYSKTDSPEIEITADKQSLTEIMDILERGSSGLHGAINKMAYMLKQEGTSDSQIIKIIKVHMDRNPVKDERWQSRYNEIERSVAGLADQDEIERLSAPITREVIKDIDWPPGVMGDIAKSVYDYSDYPYKLVSIITALGLVSGIAGRKFNVSNTGCNIYITLLMPTGSGKDVIQKYITNTLANLNPLSNGLQFLASKKHTGPKALMDELLEKPSCIAIYTEAGMLFKSSAGDSHGLLRAILDLFSSSGANQYSIGERYSNQDNNIQTLRAPALSIINEATPSTFVAELNARGSIESGELARMHIFRYEVPKPYYQPNSGEIKMSPIAESTLFKLMNDCSGQVCTGDKSDPEPINIDYPKAEYDKFARACVDEENRCMYEDTLKKSMVSRAPLKALKVAALLAIMDKSNITLEHWEWALKFYHYEMSLLSQLMDGSTGSDFDSVTMSIVMPAIVKILNDSFKDTKKQVVKPMRSKGMFTYYALTQVLKNNKPLKELGTQYKSGINIVLEHMESVGLVAKVDISMWSKAKNGYKILPEFNRIWEINQ